MNQKRCSFSFSGTGFFMKKILLTSLILLLMTIVLPGMFGKESLCFFRQDQDPPVQNSEDRLDKIVPFFFECFPLSDSSPVRKSVERHFRTGRYTIQTVGRMFYPESTCLFMRFQLNRFSEALNAHSAILASSNRAIYLVFLSLLN